MTQNKNAKNTTAAAPKAPKEKKPRLSLRERLEKQIARAEQQKERALARLALAENMGAAKARAAVAHKCLTAIVRAAKKGDVNAQELALRNFEQSADDLFEALGIDVTIVITR